MFLEHHFKNGDNLIKSSVAIYLTKGSGKDLNGKRFDFNKTILEDKPLINFEHILSYDERMHTIEIDNELKESMLSINYPSSGLAFVVTINKRPVFGGYFWPSHSSLSCNTIAVDPFDLYYSNKLHFKLGYPGIDNFSGSDPRNNRLLLNIFKQGGKLKRKNQFTRI